MNVLVIDKSLIYRTVNMMGLVRIQSPPCLKLEILLFQLIPGILLYHKLSCYFVPSFFPINSCVQNQNGHFIDSSVHSYQSKPTAFHWSEFIIINDEAIVIQLILIKWSLIVKLNRILWAKLIDRNDVLFCSFNFNLSLNMAFKWSNKKAIWTFLNFTYLNIFWSGQVFPFLCMFYVQSFRNVRNWLCICLFLRTTIIHFSVFMVDVFESFFSVILECKINICIFDDALVISEDHGWRPKEMTVISNFIDDSWWWEASFFEFESPFFVLMWYFFVHL